MDTHAVYNVIENRAKRSLSVGGSFGSLDHCKAWFKKCNANEECCSKRCDTVVTGICTDWTQEKWGTLSPQRFNIYFNNCSKELHKSNVLIQTLGYIISSFTHV